MEGKKKNKKQTERGGDWARLSTQTILSHYPGTDITCGMSLG